MPPHTVFSFFYFPLIPFFISIFPPFLFFLSFFFFFFFFFFFSFFATQELDPFHFGTVLQAMMSIYQIETFDAWDVMYRVTM